MPETRQSYQIRPETTPLQLRDQLIAMVRGRREASERHFHSFRRKLPRYYDLWRGYYSGHFTPTKNNVTIPLIFSTIWSDVARKVATAFSQWPIVGFSGFGPDDKSIAKKQEALVNAQLRDADVINKEITTFLSGDLYGTGISQVMWDHKEEPATSVSVGNSPINDEIVRIRQKRQVVTFDGPNYRNVDILDFFPQPGFRDINGNQGMQWCIVRYYLDLDQCRFLASEEGGRVFNSSEVERLASESAAVAFRHDEALQRRFEARQGISPNQTTDRYSRPVEIIEQWGMVPSEFKGSFGGSANTVISVGNNKYLFRAKETPMDHRQKPFIKYSPTPDPHYFYASGKAEIAAQLQVAGNRFINHQLDAGDLLVHPMFAYDSAKGPNPRTLLAGPGRIFPTMGDPRASIMPLPMDFRSMQAGGAMTTEMWRYIQLGSGVQEDTVIGGGGGADRQTAREFLGRREASGTRLMLESVLYDQTYLENLANMFTSLNLQFLELPRQVLILGDAAINDPVTNQPIEDTRIEIDSEVINRQYAARALGSTMSISKETEKANLLQMFQIVGSSEALAGAVNMIGFLREMFTAFGFKNVNDLVQKVAPQAVDQVQQGGPGGPLPQPGDIGQPTGGGGPGAPTSGIQGLV